MTSSSRQQAATTTYAASAVKPIGATRWLTALVSRRHGWLKRSTQFVNKPRANAYRGGPSTCATCSHERVERPARRYPSTGRGWTRSCGCSQNAPENADELLPLDTASGELA